MVAKESTIERTYNVPLRKEFMKVPRWRRTKKAVTAMKQFLAKHMKAEDLNNVKLSKELNEHVWKHGIKNPPHHVKVNVSKDEKGIVTAELFGVKKEIEEKKAVKEPAKEVTEKKEEPKEVKKEEPKVEKTAETKKIIKNG